MLRNISTFKLFHFFVEIVVQIFLQTIKILFFATQTRQNKEVCSDNINESMNKNNLHLLHFSMADYCGDCKDDEEWVYDQSSRRNIRFNVLERQMRRRSSSAAPNELYY